MATGMAWEGSKGKPGRVWDLRTSPHKSAAQKQKVFYLHGTLCILGAKVRMRLKGQIGGQEAAPRRILNFPELGRARMRGASFGRY